ncbi:MAG: YraN family protein [Acidibacter sp.]|nr:YraN family protein [Acidibacter sp.]
MRNFRARCGELDLVALHAGAVLVVEVRHRQRHEWAELPPASMPASDSASCERPAVCCSATPNLTGDRCASM